MESIPENHTPDVGLSSSSLVGDPFPNTEILICEEGSETLVSNGEEGEICIVGPQVARGYKGQEHLTAEKFRLIRHAGRSKRMYRTGDKGYLNPEGKLFICGRMNNREIKLRGFRIDLAMVEKSILDHSPEVMMASVQVDCESLIAFVVPVGVNCELIRARLAKDIPSYSMPSRISALDDLPRTANGKVDQAKVLEAVVKATDNLRPVISRLRKPAIRKALGMDTARKERGHPQLRVAVERIVTDAWIQLLRLDHTPAVDIAFFEAGGHSILLTDLHKYLLSRLPSSGLRLLDMFQNPTIERQVDHLCRSLPVEVASPESSVSPIPSPILGSISRSSSRSSVSLSSNGDAFAIVGMAGRFPGADNVSGYFDLLMQQRDGITTLDPPDLRHVRIGKGEIFIPRFGLINEKYDSHRWNLSETEVAMMDPQVYSIRSTLALVLS